MTRDLLIGVDAGTSVLKTVAFTLSGEQMALAARRNRYDTGCQGDNAAAGKVENSASVDRIRAHVHQHYLPRCVWVD